jgi:glyoxylase-like metal-dependent hydrolase (beta-lactamase superfamily II)
VRSWSIGDVTVTQVIEFKSTMAYDEQAPFIPGATPEAVRAVDWLIPHYAAPDGRLIMSVHALLVATPSLRIVVDTCVGNDKPRRMTRNQGLRTDFLQRLAAAGWTRESVDVVVCTHLHIDHIGWNTMWEDGRWTPTFPRARYLISRREYEHWSADFEDEEQVAGLADSVKPIFDAGLASLVELDHRLCPEVRLVPTTGHTPGHVSVAIESRGERAVITGDAIHHPAQMARLDWSVRFDSDRALASATRAALLQEWASAPVLVIGTHFPPPTAGRVVRDGEAYRFDANRPDIAGE